jgi:hypothetical protein
VPSRSVSLDGRAFHADWALEATLDRYFAHRFAASTEEPVPLRAKQPCRGALRSCGHTASGGLLLRSWSSLWPAFLHLLPQAVGLDQHILRTSKLPLEAKPAKVGPVPLFAFREPLNQFEVDLGVLLDDHAEGLPTAGAPGRDFQYLPEVPLEGLVEVVEDFVDRSFPTECWLRLVAFPACTAFDGLAMAQVAFLYAGHCKSADPVFRTACRRGGLFFAKCLSFLHTRQTLSANLCPPPHETHVYNIILGIIVVLGTFVGHLIARHQAKAKK